MNILPVKPQWAPAAISEIERLLRKDMVIFEWGTGMSTAWLAERVKHLFSMDHDDNWLRFAQRICRERELSNLDFLLYTKESEPNYYQMIFYISEMVGIDAAIVDGVNRMNCFAAAVKYVKKGGLIILDDSERVEYREAFNQGLILQSEYGDWQKTAVFKKP